jgi:acyl-coenzyme A thioesterase 9
LINMQAHIVYTDQNYMEIVVLAEVYDAATGQQTTTNTFYYTYRTAERLVQVIPKTYHEAMWHIDGRRKFNYSMGLGQAKL